MWHFLLWTVLSLPPLYFLIIFILKKVSHRPAPPTSESLYYTSAEHREKPGLSLSSIKSSRASVELSVIVPAYNEESRLEKGLTEAVDWLERCRTKTLDSATKDAEEEGMSLRSYEVLIVDDGSSDRTLSTALQLSVNHAAHTRNHPDTQVRVISLGKNRGKGGAVRHGILHARGELILFIDADGATKFSDLRKLIKELHQIQITSPPSTSSPTSRTRTRRKEEGEEKEEEGERHGMAIGSRAHLVSSPTVVSRTKFRNFLMNAFHLYLFILGLKDIRDTQCGFKLMTRATAIRVVDGLHVEGWIFDVELLLRAKLIKQPRIPIVEVPIEWEEIQGSKLSVVKDSIIMAVELFLIRINYLLGVWELA
ncbi:dolichyl-phosphate beta-glucosyltransferase [Puccinia graminis f. sp. tritici]|uniref:dolichyl-phosphate beta-glucosyltransferase n=1 Tax=Puccinia graminis f. sp. tritici TaxID=56615 RepID=A0A5B0M5G2_PUCGR|nr:dolichyl-phosphate beta-glucosyltransferase [Puccinia graminis f. sp. tritici]